jgi:hypothetical protein
MKVFTIDSEDTDEVFTLALSSNLMKTILDIAQFQLNLSDHDSVWALNCCLSLAILSSTFTI